MNSNNKLINVLVILFGNLIYAIGVVAFILPSGIITGGTTGLALFGNHAFNIPVSTFVLVFNICMFALGYVYLGKTFALTTAISSFSFPIILAALQKVAFLNNFTSDRFLCAIFGGLCIGFALGLVIKSGASTGGMDIPPLILNKKFGLRLSVLLYVFDCSILLLQMVFSDKEEILYGIVLVMTYSLVLDKMLLLGKSQVEVKIISAKSDEINTRIHDTLDRGSTLIHAETGYAHREGNIVLTVISNRELPKLSALVSDIDPEAFLIMGNANEVKGRGFTEEKVYENM